MSDTPDSPKPEIVGKITPWFTRRMLLMLAMFAGFSAYFFYDWKIGYPKKRVIYDTYLEFKEEQDQLVADGKKEEAEKKLNEWVKTATNNDWELNPKNFEPVKKIDDAKIAEQLYFAIGTGVLSIGILVYFLVSLRKTLAVDDEAVILPDGKRVPFSAINKVDTRRWGNKGLATITFDDGAGLKGTAKIDGLKYGGFMKPEPYQADLILNRITGSFRGDLIELEEIEDEDSGDSGESDDEAVKSD